MIRRDELLALAERCEKGSVPDRDVDWLIWFYTTDDAVSEQVPAYTASLDAALCLMKRLFPQGLGGGVVVDDGNALTVVAATLRALAASRDRSFARSLE